MKTFNELFQSAPQIGDLACMVDNNGSLFMVLVVDKGYQGTPTTKVKVIRDDNTPENVGKTYWKYTAELRESHSPTSELAKRENLK